VSHQAHLSRAFKTDAGIVFVLALAFFAFFDVTKHDPSLSAVNPFGEDPYDAIGSFGVQAAIFLGLLALLRAFRPFQAGAPSEEQRLFLLRAQLAAVLAVVITLVGDGVALARHPSLWLGSAAGGRLSALLGGLFLCAVATGVLVYRSARNARGPARSRPWRRAALVSLAAVVALALYPESIRQSTAGALFTVVVGALLLFAPLWAVLAALLPDGTAVSRREQRMASGWLARHTLQWVLVVCVGLFLGALLFVAEATQEGVAQDVAKRVFVMLVFVGLETIGVMIGFGFLRTPLGLFGARAR
jgi:Ca2+/Na+ antiporter